MHDSIFTLIWSGHQVIDSPKYFWDNAPRPSDPAVCVIQLTRAGCAFYEDAKQRRLPVPPGHAMVFMHGEDSRYGYPELETEPYVLDYIGIGGVALWPLIRYLQESVGPVIAMPEGSTAERIFSALKATIDNRLTMDRFRVSVQIYDLLMHCFHMNSAVRSPDEAIWQAREYILSNWHRPFSQEELAHTVGLSREHVNRRFRELYEISPGQFTMRIRMERAHLLLKVSQCSIEDVALQCGYTSLSSFGRAFRAHYQMSPREYRDFAQAIA